VYDSAIDAERSADAKRSLKEWGEENWEWFCRAHLIVDYLSGMTDDFAYRLYQVISGAQLE
jgi:dGTPase